MDIALDPLSPTPLYQQIRDRIVEAIAAGELRRGDLLASVRSLARAFAINPATVVKAYDLLRAEGLVASNSKSGTFVARDRDGRGPSAAFVADWQSRLVTLLSEARAQGAKPDQILAWTTTTIHDLEREQPDQGEELGVQS